MSSQAGLVCAVATPNKISRELDHKFRQAAYTNQQRNGAMLRVKQEPYIERLLEHITRTYQPCVGSIDVGL